MDLGGKMKGIICGFVGVCLCVGNLFSSEEHKFEGKHFVASYLDCDPEALANVEEVIRMMDSAVIASGASILDKSSYVFPPDGLTIVYLLSESHASLHTYPEFNACFVDLFTCGDHCTPQGFDAIFREYLKPKEVNARLFGRHQTIEEMEYK
jgi:S-adenosylmethionine decarboxylase